MSHPKKTEIITISDSEEDEPDYATPKRKANLFPFPSVKRIRPIRTPFWDNQRDLKGEVKDCTIHFHNAESNSQESGKNEFEKIVMEKAALQKQLDESKKKIEVQKKENFLIYRKLCDADSIVENQKSLILSLQKDVEENKNKAAKWESKFIKMKQSMLEVNSSLHDLVENYIKNDSPKFCQSDLDNKECYSGGPNASSTPNIPKTESQGNFTAGSSDTLTNEKHKRHFNVEHGEKNLTPTNSGSTGEIKTAIMTRPTTVHNNVPRPQPEKIMKKTKIVTKEPPQTDNKYDNQPEPLNFPEVLSVKDEDSVKLEMDYKEQLKRVLPKRARNVPLRFEEEFNTNFSIRRAKSKKCEKIPLWPVSKLHGIGDCSSKGFMCTCGCEFKGKTDLWNHIKPHIEGRRFSCYICGDGFNELEQAHRHVQEAHRNKDID